MLKSRRNNNLFFHIEKEVAINNILQSGPGFSIKKLCNNLLKRAPISL